MSHSLATTFQLRFAALPDLPVHVLRFQGTAALNDLYRIDVTILLANSDLEAVSLGDLLSSPATLSMAEAAGTPRAAAAGSARGGSGADERPAQSAWRARWHGLPTRLSTGARLGAHTIMELTLEPSLASLAGQFQNRIHLDSTSLDIVKDSLRFGGLTANRFRIEANADAYPKREFVMQYEESLLDFLWRTLQREGLALHFDQTGGVEVAVVTDSPERRRPVMDGDAELALSCAPVSGLRPADAGPRAYSASVSTTATPFSLLLKDYDWEDPNRPLAVRIPVSPTGRGDVHLWGENFSTEAEGRRLGGIIREQYLSAAEVLKASAAAPGIMPGLTVAIKDHPAPGCDDRWLVTSTRFSGSQAGRLTAALGIDAAMAIAGGALGGGAPAGGAEFGGEEAGFRNEFEASRLSTPWRPARTLPRAKVSGSVTAWIDGAGSGSAPEMDAHGRYKVLMPLDVSGRGDGKASAWIRMAQPFVGNSYGQNFPLTPGAEVLLTFVDGNPDRPVISGALPNAENFSLVNSGTSSLSGIGTKGGGGILFHDKEGEQKVSLTSGSDRGAFVLSAGSPTTAALTADYSSLMSVGQIAILSDSSKAMAGAEYSFGAGLGPLQKLLLAAQAVNAGTSIVANLAANPDDPDSRASKVADVVAKSGGCFDALASSLFLLINTRLAIQKAMANASAVAPHDNLVSIKADGDSSTGTFKSKKTSAVLLALTSSIVSKALSLSKSGLGFALVSDDISKADSITQEDIDKQAKTLDDDQAALGVAENRLDAAEEALADADANLKSAQTAYNEAAAASTANPTEANNAATLQAKTALDAARSVYDAARKEAAQARSVVEPLRTAVAADSAKLKDMMAFHDDGLKAASKRMSAAAAIGSSTASIIAQLTSGFLTILAMTKLNTPKGMLIRNDDSYLSLRAKHYGALAAGGPVIIESGLSKLSDLLRMGAFDGSRPALPVKPESFSAGDANYERSHAVLIASELTRMLAREVSLKATSAVLAEAADNIQLVAGCGPGGTVERTASERLGGLADHLVELRESAAGEADPGDIALKAAMLAVKEFLDTPNGLARDDDQTKGILLKTQDADMDAIIHTTQASSRIQLIQGAPTRDDVSSCQLTLSSSATLLQQNDDTLLNLRAAGKVLLQARPVSKLEIEGNKASLASNASVNLTMDGSTATLKAPTTIKLDLGASGIEVSATGVNIKGQLQKFNGIVQLGG